MLHRITVLFCLVFVTTFAQAEVAPFGLVVGSATLKEVRANLDTQARLKDTGINKWTEGPTLTYEGSGLGIEGLQMAGFIFNPQETLVGVFLVMPKHRFDSIKSYLQGKYRLVSAQTPSVGDKSATFRDGAVTVEVSAPHMSFEMTVFYEHQTYVEARTQGSQAEQANKAKSESGKL